MDSGVTGLDRVKQQTALSNVSTLTCAAVTLSMSELRYVNNAHNRFFGVLALHHLMHSFLSGLHIFRRVIYAIPIATNVEGANAQILWALRWRTSPCTRRLSLP